VVEADLGVVEHGMWESQTSLGSLVAAASAFACLAGDRPCDSAGGTKQGHDKPCRSCDIQPDRMRNTNFLA